MTEDYVASQKAYSDLLRHVERYSADISRGYQGVSHRQNQQAAEIEDLWKQDNEKAHILNQLGDGGRDLSAAMYELQTKVEKIAAYLKKKFPEDFTTEKPT